MAELMVTLFAAAGTSAAAGASTAAVGLTAAQTAAAVGAAGASAATWAAGTTVSAAAAGSSVLGTLSTVASIGSMAAGIMGGVMSYRDAQMQADVARMDAEGDVLASREQALRIRREAVERIGQNRVAVAASGLSLAAADPIEDSIASQMQFEAGLVSDRGMYSSLRKRAVASRLSERGTSAMLSAAGNVLGQGIDAGIAVGRRG